MTVSYSLDEKDYLTHQLYIASVSDRIKKKRLNNRIYVPVIYFGIGLFLSTLNSAGTFSVLVFFFVAVLWFLFYPLWESKRYVKHFEAFVKENYADLIGKTITLELTNDHIMAKGEGSEAKINMKELQEVADIPSNIFIRFPGGQSIIIPKEQIANIDMLTVNLKALAANAGVPYTFHETWEWK